MPKKIFKIGNYGQKGNYTIEKLKSWIGKEFNVTAGHVGDWIKNNYPKTAIPIAGTCKAVGVDENGFLLGEFNYNSFGEKIKDKYPNFSIGIGEDGNPNHIAILGYAPPHIKDLDKSFSEFSKDLTNIEEEVVIEFKEEKEKELKELKETKEPKATENNIDLSKVEINKIVAYLKNQGYEIKKKDSEFSGLTEKEIFEKAKAQILREQEAKVMKEKFNKLVPPVMKNIFEFAIDKAFSENEYNNIIEFSKDNKSTMADKLKEFSKEDSPFSKLFKTIMDNQDFNENKEKTPQEEAKELVELIYN